MGNYRHITAILLLVLIANVSYSQQHKVQPYWPTHAEVLKNYKAADALDSALKKIPVTTSLNANWSAGANQFWYRKRLSDKNAAYIWVEPEKGNKRLLFESEPLSQQINKMTGKAINGSTLKIDDMFLSADKKQAIFKTDGNWFEYNLGTLQCTSTLDTLHIKYDNDKPLQERHERWEGANADSVSPDKQWIALIKGGNIIIKSRNSSTEIKLTNDGSPEKPYGELTWSPDNKHLVGYLIDPKKAKPVYYLLSSVPGTTRAALKSHDYEQPGDEFTSYQQYLFNIETKSAIKTDSEKIDFFGAPKLHWRNGNPRYFTYEKVDRGHQRFRVIEVDVTNGKTRNIIDEKTKTFIYEQRLYTYYVSKAHQIVWITEQDGWRHIYLVDELSGKQKLITKGNWVVRDIDSVDVLKKQIWFKGSGKNAGEDPYFIHYYRINFDGKNLVDLTPEKGNHNVVLSPDRKFYIDTYSEVNLAPKILLKNTSDLKTVMELEQADLTNLLATGLRLPEVFVAKGRDGKTDIWGVVYRPANMDPAKSYPVIENIYAGPQDSFVPKSFYAVNEMESMAQLGFIVVQIDGMGTANRSKAFHDVCWHNLADAGFADRILWMKALAAKYPQVDISRIGVYGTSAGGQNSAGALLFHPEFYKAAVSACGCHDNRIDKQWWNEQWMGYPVGPHYEQQSNITNAGKLQGDLMLIVGEADTNVPPESTYRFADALIKNNKMFDLLVVPGMGHSDGGPYGRKKKRDFFVKHLLNAEPPARNTNELAQN
ncbi:S9 family peptidase [Mucilaginibacter sp. KACC 22063]|uniref:S9 family peptidase n=1 Tax=Mucilaginibacter sp. KACC 22063 TaxID=3025666 RepID=UPI0023664AF9|nr:prolyl oligopeptidase family serine peptidase [Mucilaginibacter sp. KACC 22063]WDF57286.1 prolyl oligopeptidase family serine peptidase [Mucilaginibacter sp. KACC 22063]